MSTIDPNLNEGAQIPIEERSADEIRTWNGVALLPPQTPTHNPAFDVTPARLVTAIITERGVVPAKEGTFIIGGAPAEGIARLFTPQGARKPQRRDLAGARAATKGSARRAARTLEAPHEPERRREGEEGSIKMREERGIAEGRTEGAIDFGARGGAKERRWG